MAEGRARLVGKTNLHELADGITGINHWTGTPVNPLDPAAVPGGSSSGSAVAVAAGEADIAYGTDTAGSVRIPAACCGVVGLKTTWGRIPLDGVWPLAPSLDTVGPLARDVAGIIAGMDLLEPGFAATVAQVGTLEGPERVTVGRLRLDHAGLRADPAVEAAVERAVTAGGLAVREVRLAGWAGASAAGLTVIGAEALTAHGALVGDHADQVGEDVAAAFAHARRAGHQQIRDARSAVGRWRTEMDALWAGSSDLTVVALPTIGVPAPPIGAGAARAIGVGWTLPISAAGLPALSLPVPLAGTSLKASLQLVGRPGSEALLCALGSWFEAAIAGG